MIRILSLSSSFLICRFEKPFDYAAAQFVESFPVFPKRISCL